MNISLSGFTKSTIIACIILQHTLFQLLLFVFYFNPIWFKYLVMFGNFVLLIYIFFELTSNWELEEKVIKLNEEIYYLRGQLE